MQNLLPFAGPLSKGKYHDCAECKGWVDGTILPYEVGSSDIVDRAVFTFLHVLLNCRGTRAG